MCTSCVDDFASTDKQYILAELTIERITQPKRKNFCPLFLLPLFDYFYYVLLKVSIQLNNNKYAKKHLFTQTYYVKRSLCRY